MPLHYTQTDDAVTARSQFLWAGWFGMVFVVFIVGFLGFAAVSVLRSALDGDKDGVMHNSFGLVLVSIFFGWLPVFILSRQTIRLSHERLEKRLTLFGLTLHRRFVPTNQIRQLDTIYEGDSESGAARLLVVTAVGKHVWGVYADDDEIVEFAKRLNHFRKGVAKRAR